MSEAIEKIHKIRPIQLALPLKLKKPYLKRVLENWSTDEILQAKEYMERKSISISQLASALDVCVATIRNWMRAHQIQAYAKSRLEKMMSGEIVITGKSLELKKGVKCMVKVPDEDALKVKKWMDEHNYSNEEFAKILGCSASSVSRMLYNKRAQGRLRNLAMKVVGGEYVALKNKPNTAPSLKKTKAPTKKGKGSSVAEEVKEIFQGSSAIYSNLVNFLDSNGLNGELKNTILNSIFSSLVSKTNQ